MNNSCHTSTAHSHAVVLSAMVLGLALGGCGGSESPPEAPHTGSAEHASSAVPGLVIPEAAPVLVDVYPALSSGALRHARLVELPDGILLQAPGIAISNAKLDRELAQLSPDMQAQMQTYQLLLLEQMATHELLDALALRDGADPRLDTEQRLQQYVAGMVQMVSVTDEDIEQFYHENQAMMGGAELQQVAPQIHQHLMQEKQQEVIEAKIRDLGRALPLAVAADWVREQSAQILDNPLDKARASGLPTMAGFGADSCMPCQKMKPIREAVRKKYEGRLNVVYVHADRDQMLATRYGIRGIPHMIFFGPDGEIRHEQTGIMTEEQIEAWLKNIGVQM